MPNHPLRVVAGSTVPTDDHDPYGAFASELVARGYAPKTIQAKVLGLRAFKGWLAERPVALDAIDEGTIAAFLQTRRGGPARHGRALWDFLAHLRTAGLAAPLPVAPPSRVDELVERYERHLRIERGVCQATIDTHVWLARPFLEQHVCADGSVALTAADVSAYLQREVQSRSPARAKHLVWVLRSLLRYLFQEGYTRDLSPAVLTVRDWRLTTIPKSLPAPDVERLLAACPRDTAIGRRDLAILLLLARLGLRAGEVVALALDDIDWRAGTMSIRAKKGLRQERLPLPVDVGRALATYLRRDRPVSATRRVFLRMRAPRGGFAGAGGVTTVVRKALARAGLHPPRRGAHLLRHSLAVRMLHHGASFGEIGAVLRHRGATSTEIYAKVDLKRLRVVVQPWPESGGAQ
jgi:site-specific recombinase XerD